ncbi:exportin-6-like [Salvelinus namaycush]|uniref:Exportin-6-like n=1 Tax=Salvelinus namaycush TaxID=8040 RepID=A0A8U0R949_SALNM|nr:exportin-6-like [Salvelinus namaycush]XP_038855770.1 exportin-6-like [Salvelinus namaycush]
MSEQFPQQRQITMTEVVAGKPVASVERIKRVFRTSMLFHFINVLLQVLLHKSHNLLQEEIALAVYNMASVDFDAFYSSFMTEFLNGCQSVDANQRAVLCRNFKLET